MSKIELSGTSGGYNISAINENFQTIEEVLNDKVLWRDNPNGASNVMNNHLDMNGFLILNSPSLGGGDEGDGGEGGDGTDGFSNAIVYAYKRSATLPTGNPGVIVYEFANHTVITPAGNELANGWTKGIPEGNDPLYVTVVTASSRNATDTIAANEWASPVILSKDGVSAINTAVVYIYQRTPTEVAPSSPSAPVTYFFSNGIVTGLNNGWTSTIPASFGGKYLWVSTATAATLEASDIISASEWSAGQLLSQDGLDGENGGANGLSNATFYAYKRSATVPTNNPGPVTYHFPSASITTPSTDALANEWFKSPPAGTNQLYVVVASASASTDTDTIEANEWTAPAAMGSNGLNTATLYVYQRTASATAPVKPGATATYDFISKMVTGLTNNWSVAIPPATGNKYLWVTTATAASASSTDSIPSDEWAVPQLLAQDGTNGTNGTSGSNGSNGTRGTVTLAYAISGTSWSNTEATNALITAGYYPPINRDIVTLYNSGAGFSQTRFYDSGTWVTLTAYIDGNLLVTGTLSANKITGGTLQGVSIKGGSGLTPGGAAFEVTTGNLTWIDTVIAKIVTASNTGRTTDAVRGETYNSACGVVGATSSFNSSPTAHALRGKNDYSGSAGLVGSTIGYDFYAEGTGTNYGPFTGAHDGLLLPTSQAVPGDILVDVECISRSTLSNTIFHVEASSTIKDKKAVGVLVNAYDMNSFVPAAFVKERIGDVVATTESYVSAVETYKRCSMNALGEGQVNVCGENGDIEAGDYIVTSSMSGKGMRQEDDVQRNYTVARARESVVFDSPTEVKQVACIYLCG